MPASWARVCSRGEIVQIQTAEKVITIASVVGKRARQVGIVEILIVKKVITIAGVLGKGLQQG